MLGGYDSKTLKQQWGDIHVTVTSDLTAIIWKHK